jgi:putative oxidoreductase
LRSLEEIRPVETLALDYPYSYTYDKFSAGLLIIRVLIGLTLAAHGYAKFFSGGRIPGTAGWFDSIGMRPGRVHALAAACTEIGAGVFFAVGFLTPLAGAAMVSLMLVAAWTVHKPNGFFIVKNGYEYNFILATIAVGVSTAGAGRYSLDHAINDPEVFLGWGGFLISLVGGLAAGAFHLAVFYRPPAKSESA